MARRLEDALVMEHTDPRAALKALARVDRANRDSRGTVFLDSVGSVLIAGTIASALTRDAEDHATVVALLVLATVGFAPPTYLWYVRQNRMYDLGRGVLQLASRAVLWAPVLVVQELALLLASLVVVTLPLLLILSPTGVLPEPVFEVSVIAAIVLGIAVGLADVLPIVLLAPAYGLAETVAGLRLNAAKTAQFGVAVLAGWMLGTGALGLVYLHWWQALLAAGVAGVLLGLALEPLPPDLTLSYLVELARIRCDIRLGRLGSARWRIRHLLPRVHSERSWPKGAGWYAAKMTALLAECLERPSGQRWWATGTTAQDMGASFSALMFRNTRQQERLNWVRLKLDRVAELRELSMEDLRGLPHESSWTRSVESTIQLVAPPGRLRP